MTIIQQPSLKEEALLDLKQIMEQFIRTQGWISEKGEGRLDSDVIQAINGITMDPKSREKQLVDWLNHYRVLLFFPPEKSREVARQIIAFADERRDMVPPMGKYLIISEYTKLRGRIQQAAPTLKNGTPRGVTSLTSKALWCCYPHDVPIFDSNALRTVHVITRLCGMTPRAAATSTRMSPFSHSTDDLEYSRFVDAWFQIYEIVKPTIDLADIGGYPKVRVLDQLLWYLGQPSFDAPPVDT